MWATTESQPEGIEIFLADMGASAQRMTAEVEVSAQRLAASIQALGQPAVKGFLAFATRGCAKEFGRCFEAKGWPAVETPECWWIRGVRRQMGLVGYTSCYNG